MIPYISHPSGIINNRQQIFVINNKPAYPSVVAETSHVYRLKEIPYVAPIINLNLGQKIYTK
ncbi:hypothetical protein EB118_26315 [bacterium]|nr:hypothetical protein [bacterium]NDD85947.1 hypothetical protein [bacterium]NDG33557.1 hypothetical protein [bacterium]